VDITMFEIIVFRFPGMSSIW